MAGRWVLAQPSQDRPARQPHRRGGSNRLAPPAARRRRQPRLQARLRAGPPSRAWPSKVERHACPP
eukprot:2560606-Lingulodinium_polyedra.AAC.1